MRAPRLELDVHGRGRVILLELRALAALRWPPRRAPCQRRSWSHTVMLFVAAVPARGGRRDDGEGCADEN